MIKKILSLFKSKSSKNKNIKINRLAYIKNTEFEGNNYIDRFCKIKNSSFGKYSYVGFNSDFNNVKVGNYCSISSNVKMGLGKHPTNHFSSSPVFYSNNNPFGVKEAYTSFEENPQKTIVENDVWIGANVIVMDGVTIGTGAIVAAGSVITKDIAPYEIVGGVPAKVIKKRFEEETIDDLLQSKWWYLEPRDLKRKNFNLDNIKF